MSGGKVSQAITTRSGVEVLKISVNCLPCEAVRKVAYPKFTGLAFSLDEVQDAPETGKPQKPRQPR